MSLENSTLFATQNSFYVEFKDAGFQLRLFGPAFILASLASVGIPLNFSVCYITLKYRSEYKTLGSPTSLLIASYSFFELLHQSSHFCFLAVSASGTNFIPIRVAFFQYFQCLAVIGFTSINLNVFCLSFDRLFAVAIPIFYRKTKDSHFYILAHFLLIAAYNVFPFYYTIKAVQRTPEWPVTGSLADVNTLPDPTPMWVVGTNTGFLVLATIFYMIVALVVRCRTELISNSLRRLYRSLALIVGINLGGYLASTLLMFALHLWLPAMTAADSWLYTNCSACILNLAAISNAPILFINSQDYQAAYQREWQWIAGTLFCCKGKSKIAPAAAAVIPPMPAIRVLKASSTF